MNIIKIIEKKREKMELTKEEIDFFVYEYTNNKITDYQAAAMIMAIYLNGMTKNELTNFTIAMANSGEILDLSDISNIIVDKHSTGGVGDKVTLILMPVIASLGIPVSKMSGRGLGFTGGTVDKLESIPGYNTKIDIQTFKKNVKEIGISIIGQTLNLAPADKKIYELRDSIACVNSIPLIASSIMSKKIASGANKLVLDVTAGKGAFMDKFEDTIELANIMKNIGQLANKEVIAVITNMDQPLGYAIGNTLEVIEAVNALNGEMEKDVEEVVCTLGAYMLKLAKFGNDIESNKKLILENLKNKKAYNKFIELIKKQGGDISYIENTQKFEKAKYVIEVKSEKAGFVQELDARKIGELSLYLGAGRIKKEDSIDTSAGIILKKKISNSVNIGETLAILYTNNKEKLIEAENQIKNIYKISENKSIEPKTILQVI